MLTLHQQLAAARTDHDKTILQRQITATDRQIDLSACGHAQAGRLVYELYELTEEEIRIIVRIKEG